MKGTVKLNKGEIEEAVRMWHLGGRTNLDKHINLKMGDKETGADGAERYPFEVY